MKRPPITDVPNAVDRELTKIFLRLSQDPGDLRRVLLGLAAALKLTAIKLALQGSNNQRAVWDDDNKEHR